MDRHIARLNHAFTDRIAAGESPYDAIRAIASHERMLTLAADDGADSPQCDFYLTRSGRVLTGWYDSPVGDDGWDTGQVDLSGLHIVRLRIDGHSAGDLFVRSDWCDGDSAIDTPAYYRVRDWLRSDCPDVTYHADADGRLHYAYGDGGYAPDRWRQVTICHQTRN